MFRLLMAVLAVASLSWAQSPADLENTTCTFQDGHGIRIEYTPQQYEVKSGKIWTPGGRPTALFLDTGVTIDNISLPVGAYGLYILPAEKGGWTLVVNKNAKPAAAYDSKQDLARARMDSGDLGHKVGSPRIALLHIAPTQCNIRVYAGSTMAWTEIKEKQ